MRNPIQIAVAAFAAVASLAAVSHPALAQNVVTYHNTADRHGVYTVPGLTDAAAAGIHLGFKAPVSGNVYAQPLYWKVAGKPGLIIVATESNLVYALNANSGAVVWRTQLAAPVPSSNKLPCGDISPEGITGTPVIDPASRRLYLDATTYQSSLPRHKIYALSLDDGKIVPHWPINVDNAMAARHAPFTSELQGERSALQFFKGKLYITYAGRAGDCGSRSTAAVYRGVVIEVTPSTTPAVTGNWETRAARGGIWSQGGATSDGTSLFVTTGNTSGANVWGDGEAVVRLMPGLARSSDKADSFTPADWKDLDNEDLDLGGTAAIPFSVNTGSGKVDRMLALGKDGRAYLLNAANLGGIGHALLNVKESNSEIITGPAAYEGAQATWVVFTNPNGLRCSGGSLTMLRITAKPNHIGAPWCAPLDGSGSPIITTSNGVADPIVWVLGAEGDNELHAFDLLTGKVLFNGGGTGMSGLHRYGTLIAANRHLYVAADNTLYAFTF
jgi:outer membrane protein assembly factor BamB